MRLLIKALVVVSTLLAPFISHAQESETYFFLGNIYCQDKHGEEQRFPYLPVAMARQDAPDRVLAVMMSNAVGEVSFRGVPMDISRGYIFTITLPSGTYRFLFSGIPSPTFESGNVSIHMKLDSLEKYLTLRTIVPAKEHHDRLALDVATEAIQGATRSGVAIADKAGLNYRLFLSGRAVRGKKMTDALAGIHAGLIEKIVIAHPTHENDYFAGSIDFVVDIGKRLRIEPTTYTLPRLP